MTLTFAITGEPVAGVAVIVKTIGTPVNANGFPVKTNEFGLIGDGDTAMAVELLLTVIVGAPVPISRLLFASSGIAAMVCGTMSGIVNPVCAFPIKHGDAAEMRIDLGTAATGVGVGVGTNGVGVPVG